MEKAKEKVIKQKEGRTEREKEGRREERRQGRKSLKYKENDERRTCGRIKKDKY